MPTAKVASYGSDLVEFGVLEASLEVSFLLSEDTTFVSESISNSVWRERDSLCFRHASDSPHNVSTTKIQRKRGPTVR